MAITRAVASLLKLLRLLNTRRRAITVLFAAVVAASTALAADSWFGWSYYWSLQRRVDLLRELSTLKGQASSGDPRLADIRDAMIASLNAHSAALEGARATEPVARWKMVSAGALPFILGLAGLMGGFGRRYRTLAFMSFANLAALMAWVGRLIPTFEIPGANYAALPLVQIAVLAAAVLTPTARTHLTLENRWGSVEHYWHFMMGFFLPLASYYSSLGRGARRAQMLVRSCGPMDRHLRDLGWRGLRLLNRDEHGALSPASNAELNFVRLRGMDHVDSYDRRTIETAVSFLEKEWAKGAGLVPVRCRLLVVERGEPDPFYLSDTAEIREAGNHRRSIPNMAQVLEWAQRSVGSVLALQLEQLPLRRQYEYFRGAEVVLYQHGAAMANLVFCRRGTRVIEILPRTLIHEVRDMAKELCALLDLRYFRVDQLSEHSPVDIPAVLAALEPHTYGERGDALYGPVRPAGIRKTGAGRISLPS